MNHNMSTTFVHSVKVPRLYKESAKTVQKVLAEGASFKSLVFKPNHPNVQGIYALVSETLHHSKELQILLDKTNILVENPRLDPWLARVLITELLWGKKVLKSEAKPLVTVRNYSDKLQQALAQNLDATVDPCDKRTVKLPRYVRINTLLTSIDEALKAFYDEGWNPLPSSDSYSSHLKTVANLGPYDFIQDFHIPEVLIFAPGTKFHNHPGYLNGKLLLQDKASCLSAFLLDPKPDSEILDMCAAPGMKTTHLAAIINNSGKIYAIEMNANRYKTLCDFVTQTNATCIETINADVLTISPDQYPNIKYILVDPSCSGSGMVDRIDIRVQGQGDLFGRLRKLQNVQSMILGHALTRFPNVKKVVYSTCSIHSQENEWVVEEAMRKVGDKFTLVNLKKKMNNEWNNFGSMDYGDYGERCLYALPNKDLCSGFFVALFERKSKKSDGDEEVVETQDENGEENGEHKCSLKRENDGVDRPAETNGDEEVSLQKSKKKKKKKKIKLKDDNEHQPDEVGNDLQAENLEEERSHKKTKKKHKKLQDSAEEVQAEIQTANDEANEEVTSKKKKRKKSSQVESSTEGNEPVAVIEEENNEEDLPKKSKKSKKQKKNKCDAETEE